MKIVQPPYSLSEIENSFSVFLAGSIEMGIAENWQETIINELEQYNPELLYKQRILAITKSDMIDQEMKDQMKEDLPVDLPCLFISSIAQQGLSELKDLIWTNINND